MIVCFLCKKKKKLKTFCDKTFEKCFASIQIRKSRGITYGDLLLSTDNRSEYGYHLDCYKKVTVLKRRYQELDPITNEAAAISTDKLLNTEAQTEIQTRPDMHNKANVILDLITQQENIYIDTTPSSAGAQTEVQTGQDLSDKENVIPNPNILQDVHIVTVPSTSELYTEILAEPHMLDKASVITLQDLAVDTVALSTEAQLEIQMELYKPDDVTNSTLELNPLQDEDYTMIDTAPSSTAIQSNIQTELNMPDEDKNVVMNPNSSQDNITEMDTGEFAVNQPGTISVRVPGPDMEPSTSHTQNTDKFCIFCKQQSKRVGSRREFVVESSDICCNIFKEIAAEIEDIDLYEKLGNCEKFYYHKICSTMYRKHPQKTRDILHENSDWYAKRKVHSEAFAALEVFIKLEILDGEKIIYLTDLFMRYKAILYEINDESNYGQSTLTFENYHAHHLEVKIMKHFSDCIVIENSQDNLKKKIVYKKNIDIQTLVNESISHEQQINETVRNVAFEVRKSIKSSKIKKLPQNLHPDAINEGECDISELLHTLISSLVQGPDVRRQIIDDDQVKINAVCQDLIYIIYKGQVKPAKHLKLGMAIKSITNSRKVLNILNKLGHSISYPVVESLETELTYSAIERNQLIPSGIRTEKGHSTHLAFDNYDRYVDTRTGKDTLHDTVGIIYQFSCGSDLPQKDKTDVDNTGLDEPQMLERQRRRKRFQQLPQMIEPYLKKPKAFTSLTPVETMVNHNTGNSEKIAAIKDLLWVFSMSRIPNETPMWTGYNSYLFKDNSERQTIDYLPQINLSPTSYTVVNETLRVAENIRKECEKDNIIVTYDLAIAKMAQQIQIAETPTYDNIFINLGAFHIQMAFFKALGKFIDCSGLENILTECGILAQGSLNAFLSGTHFNRCKRIHPLTMAALHCLLIERFISETGLDVNQIDDMLKEVMRNKTEGTTSPVIPRLLEYYIEEYDKYKTKTLEGEHGKTAQFYVQYMEFMSIFLKFSRAIRSQQLDLYTDSLFEMADMFFIFNHQNYARWLMKYLSDLIELRDKAPELVKEFERGAFGIKRKEIDFSRSPVDLTLEQTINANAGNKLTGLIHLTNSLGARQRWALSHSVRTKIITQLIDDLNINNNHDVNSDLRKHNMKSNEKAFNDLVSCIKQHLNPFGEEIDKENLFNISSGRAATEETTTFLLSAKKTGAKQKLQFIKECNEDKNRFEKPLKRNKIVNFASECAKKTQIDKLTSTVAQVKMERDIFGRLLAIALEKKVNMEEIISYPLAPVPPALAQYNGDICKTNKAKLGNYLKSKVQCTTPPDEDVLLIDGYFFLRTLGPLPQKFGETSEFILKKMCKTEAKEIHLILDKYTEPSIKDIERCKRSTEDTPYQITGPNQQRPHQDISKSLTNIKFKEAFIKFLITDWERDALVPIIGEKKIYITNADQCFSFENINNKIHKKEETRYWCTHEEADTRIAFHLSQVKPGAKVLIRCSDTDILVIILGNMHLLSNCSQIWITSNQRNLSHNCTELAAQLGDSMCKALPALHSYTGCDYTSSLKGKGKLKAFNLLESNTVFKNLFASLDSPEDVNDEGKMKELQKFTCKLYQSTQCDVNQARFDIFNKKYGQVTKKSKLLKKIINFNASTLPPCWKSLKQHILRSLLVTSMWRNASKQTCLLHDPSECGWVLDGNKYEIFWFHGDPTPLNVDDIIVNEDQDQSDCSCDSSDEE